MWSRNILLCHIVQVLYKKWRLNKKQIEIQLFKNKIMLYNTYHLMCWMWTSQLTFGSPIFQSGLFYCPVPTCIPHCVHFKCLYMKYVCYMYSLLHPLLHWTQKSENNDYDQSPADSGVTHQYQYISVWRCVVWSASISSAWAGHLCFSLLQTLPSQHSVRNIVFFINTQILSKKS